MSADRESEESLRRILRLAPDCDPTSLALTPEEGFLLSRIDGCTPWRLLREIGCMDAEEADLCVEGWIASGVVKVEGLAPDKPRSERTLGPSRTPDRAKGATPTHVDETLIDAGLDLPPEIQRRILTFETRLSLPYHELLDVKEDADAKDIKRAYFKLSREFHPDRFFRRRIGHYVERLERIFKKVLEGYEILSDPELRVQLGVQQASAEQATLAASPTRPLTKLERLQQRMPYRIPEKVLNERRQKARELVRAAELSERKGNLQEAIASVRIAISFDPMSPDLRASLVDMQARNAEKRALALLAECTQSHSNDTTELNKVLKLLEDVLLYRPHDPALNSRASHVCLQLDEVAKAEVYAQTALEHSPDVAAYHTAMGLVHKAKGEKGHAKKEFERALELDPDDVQARKMVASLRLGRTTSQREAGNG
jgi:tetratricopeptide (TPR) repeat protein